MKKKFDPSRLQSPVVFTFVQIKSHWTIVSSLYLNECEDDGFLSEFYSDKKPSDDSTKFSKFLPFGTKFS